MAQTRQGARRERSYAAAGAACCAGVLRSASMRNPNASPAPTTITIMDTIGRYQSQATAITTGATTAVTMNDTNAAPAPKRLPMNGTTSAITTIGSRINL